jgi:fumarate hydratase class II
LGVLTESGANAHMNVTTVLLKDGIEYQTHTYDSSAKIKNSAARNIFIGGTDIPGALEAALQKMIRNQLIPDLQNDLK